MNLEKPENARLQLPNWNGPFYPKRIEDLNEVTSRIYLDFSTIQDVCKRLLSYSRTLRTSDVITSDKYTWRTIILFRGKGELRISLIAAAFPWERQRLISDGGDKDRSIALYTYGEISEEELNEFLDKLISVVERYQASRIGT